MNNFDPLTKAVRNPFSNCDGETLSPAITTMVNANDSRQSRNDLYL